MVSPSTRRPASSVGVGSATSTKPSRRTIKNPFRRNDPSSTTRSEIPSSASSPSVHPPPPPAYSTLPVHAGTASGKPRAASLFSWKSGKMSWAGFSSLRGKTSTFGPGEEQDGRGATTHPELPSSADRLKSTWKRRQNRHGVLDFEVYHPPFVVEIDSLAAPPTSASAPTTSVITQSFSPSISQPFPARSTFTPSPVPPVSPRTPALAQLPSPNSTPRATTSRLPRISENTTRSTRPELNGPLGSTASSSQPSPDLVKHAFSDRFPLPPSRRPSSAELVNGPPSGLPTPTRTLLSPPRNLPPNRLSSASSLPRPKNGPYTPRNPYPAMTLTSRLPTPTPSVASTRTASTGPRSPSQSSVRKPISIPARPRSSPRLAAVANSALAGDGRTSWDSMATVTRSSSASGGSDETVVSPADLKNRTSLVVPITAGNVPARETRPELERTRKEEDVSEEDRKRFEREVEEMFSEQRMQDLLIQLGI
ncbi:hypothetical protein JCM16303_006354 [Sporobolomyces ruberrimus]